MGPDGFSIPPMIDHQSYYLQIKKSCQEDICGVGMNCGLAKIENFPQLELIHDLCQKSSLKNMDIFCYFKLTNQFTKRLYGDDFWNSYKRKINDRDVIFVSHRKKLKLINLKSGSKFFVPRTICQSKPLICKDFYHANFTENKCEANVCNCENGVTVEECYIHNTTICKSCNYGYYKNSTSEKCDKNQCSCENGIAKDVVFPGRICPSHGMEYCHECDSGYILENYNFENNYYRCRRPVCYCNYGVNAINEDCPADNTHKCTSCNSGYELNPNNDICEFVIRCWCDNGQRTDSCARHNHQW